MNTFTAITVNGKTTFPSSATTVAELKADLIRNGISVDNMAIQEALTRTLLTSDSQVLPHDVPYKGSTTSNLVFRLTLKEKKIPSGAYTRSQMLSMIDSNEDLKNFIHQNTGYNYYSVPTSTLAEQLSAYFAAPAAPEAEDAPAFSLPAIEDLPALVQAIINVLDESDNLEYVDASDITAEAGRLKVEATPAVPAASETPNAAGYTDSELDRLTVSLDDPNA